MPATYIDDHAAENIGELIDKHSAGEDLVWSFNYSPHPEFGVVMMIHIWTPSGIIGQKFVNTVIVTNPSDLVERSENLDKTIGEILIKARAQRGEMLAQAQAEAANGEDLLSKIQQGPPQQGPPPSLIPPGG